MTIVYGSSIEPGGMELDDYTMIAECENCGKTADIGFMKTVLQGQ